MTAQLGIWLTCSDFQTWATALLNKDDATLNNILNTSIGLKLLAISLATGGVVAYCIAVTPEVAAFVSKPIISGWNAIIASISEMLPPGVTLVIQGITLTTL